MNEYKGIPRKRLPAGVRTDTLAVREGLPATPWGENSEALFLTSSFVHPDCATAAARFANEEDAFVYSRFSNPTVAMFERRLAAMEGTEACIATASGMAAILILVMGLLQRGDHVVCSQSVFGSTIRLFQDFAKFGVDTTFVPQEDADAWRAAMRPNTKMLFAETPSNPLTTVSDIAALAGIAHAGGALLVVDNCFCSPALQLPVNFGADLVMHSGTKYLDGQGRVMAGAVCGPKALVEGKLVPVMRSAGMCLSPFNAWVVLKGLETLSIRMRAQSARAAGRAVAGGAAAGRARVAPVAGVASAACAGDGAAGRAGRCGGVLRAARGRCGRGAPARLRADRRHADLLDHRQPRRHQDHDHAPVEHQPQPAERGAAPGRRHHPGADPAGGGARGRAGPDR